MDAATDECQPLAGRETAVTPTKRPLSDTFSGLAPSPRFRESSSAPAPRDDNAIHDDSPRTPRRTSFLARGLSLQMPQKSISMSNPSQTPAKTPLSPQLDPTMTYGSPATSLPRHSRGLDFSRASTHLHHSTLAESSPDSSPIVTHKSLNIPSRKGSINSMMLDSPNLGPTGNWPAFLQTEKSAISSSVGSVNMLTSPIASSGSSDEDLSDEAPDEVMTTPHVSRLMGESMQTPYNPSATPGSSALQSPSTSSWSNNFSPAAASLMKNFQRSRFRRGRRSRKSSSSASGQSAVPSPRTTSPPPVRSIESANGYFGWGKFSSSRRESLALGTESLHLSSSNDSGDERGDVGPKDADSSLQHNDKDTPSNPAVIRRAVTRRGNLLPKTKGFARIRAALMEESAPIDTDVRREAETIKQVRERDDRPSFSGPRQSPSLLPSVPGPENVLEDIPESESLDAQPVDETEGKGPVAAFGDRARANAGYWRRLDRGFRTPPPPSFRQGSSMDVSMDSPLPSLDQGQSQEGQVWDGMEGLRQPLLTKAGKRARDEDDELVSIKRRAVSPSLSVGNSPVVSQSPRERERKREKDRERERERERERDRDRERGMKREETDWGGPPGVKGRESSVGEREKGEGREVGQVVHRSNSGGSVGSVASGVVAAAAASASATGQGVGPKRVGLQSMTDTNDGLMKMSIE
ncbi:hypothetical protein CAC42_5494 [Sphaceloma murrayae]|uniref:Uncharacterized protein n=1 Tax=Sphaceloma murrayae TaxID=2082308 RepID=A0A2K1QKE7_9PEZI|nr:hypothetical protein CAC42_5494 [Sphaceloma murrayae]